MPFCTNCGAEMEGHHKFCPSCGAPTEQTPASGGETPASKKGVLGDIDREDIEEGVERGVEAAKKGLGAAFRLARRGIKQGAELAGKGIDAAKETIEERKQDEREAEQETQGQRLCPQCGQPVIGTGKFCSHCGHKLG